MKRKPLLYMKVSGFGLILPKNMIFRNEKTLLRESFLLGSLDSNQDTILQRDVSCRWTTPQFNFPAGGIVAWRESSGKPYLRAVRRVLSSTSSMMSNTFDTACKPKK